MCHLIFIIALLVIFCVHAEKEINKANSNKHMFFLNYIWIFGNGITI